MQSGIPGAIVAAMSISMGATASYAYCQNSKKIPLSMQAGVLGLSTLYIASTDNHPSLKFRPGRALLGGALTSALSYGVGFAAGAIYSGAARHQDV